MKLGYIGLGKMGFNMVERLLEKGHEVTVFDTNRESVRNIAKHGAHPSGELKSLTMALVPPRLVRWLKDAFEEYGEDLREISGSVSQSGEGIWTVEAARELGIPVPIIEGAVNFRMQSEKKPGYTGKILSALRNQFGGHEVFKKRKVNNNG